MADPENYWESSSLNLYFKTPKDCSVDENGAKTYKTKQTVPKQYVTNVQLDLIALGYLEDEKSNKDGYFGRAADWAVQRFQRRAASLFRKDSATGKKVDITSSDKYSGSVNGVVDSSCATEIRKWIDKKWVAPLGIYPLEKLTEGGKMRKDAAEEWEKIVKEVAGKGGTLKGPYGDTTRGLNLSSKAGTSKYSLHYTGRAVDINQAFANWKGRRYYMRKDSSGSDMYWIIYCKTDKQDGTQGTEIKKGAFKYWDFGGEKEISIPEGYYINLTDMIQASGKFSRIKAQSGWDDKSRSKAVRYNKTEWWHFAYTVDLQETFQDECELIGHTQETLISRGWNTHTMLGHKPG